MHAYAGDGSLTRYNSPVWRARIMQWDFEAAAGLACVENKENLVRNAALMH